MAGRRLVSVMGSTGSIGVSTLDVIARHPDRFEVFALAANSSVDAMLEQCLAFTGDRQLVLEEDYHEGRLPAGHYLAKVGAFSVELLDVYGEVRRLDIEND